MPRLAQSQLEESIEAWRLPRGHPLRQRMGVDFTAVYDELQRNPLTVREAARRLGISLETASVALAKFRKTGQARAEVVGVPYKSGSIHYWSYKLHGREPLDPEVSPHYWDLFRIKRDYAIPTVSEVGRKMAEMAEGILRDACLSLFPREMLIFSPFGSPRPDVLILPDEYLMAEICIRTENPVDVDYLERKVDYRDRKCPEYDLLVIAPEFSREIWKEFHKPRNEVAAGEIYLERIPVRGFPIFPEFMHQMGAFSLLGREVELITQGWLLAQLRSILRRYSLTLE